MVSILATAFLLGLGIGSNHPTLTPYQQCLQNPSLCPTRSTVYAPPTHTFGRSWYSPLVSTPLGLIRGLTWNSRSGKMYFAFLGIPYAEIPARFEASRPLQPWTSALDATRFGPMCLQMDLTTNSPKGAEHCLFMNIYTPQIAPPQELMPVMIWIHGESWQRGGGDQLNPKYFMDHPVVLVTFNYRLNAFGFLNTGDGESQGNIGLKDQLMALWWVKNNIKSFGGDPNRITLFGNEAGAASVHFHMLSPLSQGLFNFAISQSGSALCPWAISKNPLLQTKKLGEMLWCNGSSSNSIMNCLKMRSDREIMEAQSRLGVPGWTSSEPILTFGPVVETNQYNAFLPDHPLNLITKGQTMKLPWIVGFVEDEGRFHTFPIISNPRLCSEAHSNWKNVAPVSFLYNDTRDQASKDDVSSKIRVFYVGDAPIDQKTMADYSNMYTDRLYKSCILGTVKIHAGQTNVYPYILKFKGDFNYADMMMRPFTDPNRPAPSHNDELHYLFNWKGSPEIQPGSLSYEFSEKLINLWVSFASKGYPASTWGTTPVWRPYNSINKFEEWYVLDYDTHSVTVTTEELNRLEFWKGLPIPSNFKMEWK